MTWEQKLQAMKAIADHKLIMRKPGDWYVNAPIEVGGGGVLVSMFGQGTTPEMAVNDHWAQLVENLPSDRYITGGNPGHSKCVRWNGFMWEDASHMRRPLSRAKGETT